MSAATDPDLIKVTEIFLVPSSFLVAALGTADSNPHRAAVSAMGLVISVLWWACSREAFAERHPAQPDSVPPSFSQRVRIMYWLPIFFIVCWAASSIVHLFLWTSPLGH